jgi:hypothetical protein
MITAEIKEYIERSVLCWLATVKDGQPSVSPKEIFTHFGKDRIIIGNIASPQSVENIKSNQNVCVSFIDVFAQRGFQLYGVAEILDKTFESYSEKCGILQEMAGNQLKVLSVIEISINRVNQILAPNYRFNEKITEETMIENALKLYNVTKLE